MNQKNLKTGTELNLRVGDVSLTGTIARQSKQDEMIRVIVDVQWTLASEGFQLGDECIINCKSDDGSFEDHKMILMERSAVENKSPVLSLQYFKKVKSRGELRRHFRFDTFIFTEVGEQKSESESDVETTLNGTISNLSISGCSLMSGDSFEIGKKLILVFDLSEGNARFKVNGFVKNLRQSHLEEAYYYGLEFVDLTADVKKAISSFLENIQE